MLPQELKDYVKYIQEIQSETEDIEVKAANQGCPKRLYDTLSSFSNKSGGGVIIFGLDESKSFEVVGVYDPNDLQKQVTNQCNQMEPRVRPEFTILQFDNGNIVVSAEIPEILQEEKPCYYLGTGIQKGSYVRVGDSDEPMTSYETYNLMSYKKRIEEDLRVIEKSSIDDLDSDLLKKYIDLISNERPNFSKFNYEVALEKLGILRKLDNEYKPTLAGLLCFGICPEFILPQLVITAAVIPGFQIGEIGELGERFLDNKKITGTISQMIKGAVEFVTKNMKKKTIVRNDTGQRDDKFEYPVAAVREAIINALVHRDYSLHTESSYISIRMFNDRIEITSPGGLYGDLTIENLNNIVNPPVRNKNLVRILEEMGELENRSSGIATMIREMRTLKLEPPVFEDKRGNFTVSFKNHNLMTKEDQQWIKDTGHYLTENEAYTLVFIKRNGKITNGDYQKINNVNRDKALLELKGLISKELIKPEGVGSGTYYILNEEKVLNLNKEVDVVDKKENKTSSGDKVVISGDKVAINNNEFNENEILVINYLKANKTITNKDLRIMAKIKESGANKVLRGLVEKNIITAIGEKRGRHYILNEK